MPTQQLDPKIKNVWRINDAIWIVILFLCCFIPFAVVQLVHPTAWCFIVLAAEVIAFVALLVLFLLVLPPIRYARWRYELSNEFLDIARGIIWRKHITIPFIRVQSTDTKQGPILRAFGLSAVTAATAAGEHEIPGLETSVAEQLRDRVAEFARIAQEDV